MVWACGTCKFENNPDSLQDCIACGTTAARASAKGDRSQRTETFQLEPKQKLGVKLTPPKHGIIEKGITIENIDNPLLESKIEPGDRLVAIGDQQLHGIGFSDAIELIRTKPRPLQLTFDVNESRRKAARKKANEEVWDMSAKLTTYAVVFDDGPMGLNLEEAVRIGIDGAVVKALKGQAEESGMISIGDIVSRVNDVDVLFMPYKQVMETIRNTAVPRTLQFVPKDKLVEIQRIDSRQSEIGRETLVKSRYTQSKRLVKDVGLQDEKTSIKDLIMQNKSATIKKGRMFKQGRLMRNWKSRYFVLSVSKIEYFKNTSASSLRGELTFINNDCSVRSLPAMEELVSRTPPVKATYLLELRVGDRKLVMACGSEADKQAWIDALKLAIDASKAVTNGRPSSISDDGTRSSSRSDAKDNDGFPKPIVHITVLSASNLTKKGSTVNGFCEISLGDETFRTSTVKNNRSPVWKQDNTAVFETKTGRDFLEICIVDEHTFRANELISTLQVPIQSLPNMQKTIKKYPLVVSNRSGGAQLTLSLELIDKKKAYEQEQERLRLGEDLARASVMMERDEMLKIQSEAQAAADEASHMAKKAEEEANAMLEEARLKAEAAVAAAKKDAEQGKAAVEAAVQEATLAREEAERQAKEAKQAKEQAQAVLEANKAVQQSAQKNFEGQQLAQQFIEYRRMLTDNISQEDVRKKMLADGVNETNVIAFFEGQTWYDTKIKRLQDQVANLSKQKKDPRKVSADIEALAISGDQEKLLRRLLKLEKQLQQAGISIAEDIPYEEAKAQVAKISARMQEIGSSDVTHPDPEVQTQLREEYFKLEQEMEKYNTALMLTDEFAAEQERKEQEWEERNRLENMAALYAIRRAMPVNVKQMSEAQLAGNQTPNGKKLPLAIARKFKRTNVLELLRTNPDDITKMHPILLENLRMTGLTVTERRALHIHLKDVAEGWKAQQKEEMAGRRCAFFKVLLSAFKPVVNAYNNHVEQYGPPGNHPYATRDDPDNGCPLIGRQCPLKANANPAYVEDFGFPDGDEYAASTVQKSDAEDAGAKALREAKELARNKAANARADLLKKHYKGQIREVALANGACEEIENHLDRLEVKHREWIKYRLNLKGTENKRTEVNEFSEMLRENRLAILALAGRAGMKTTGKRNAKNDDADTRSAIEIVLCELLIEAMQDCLREIEKRMKQINLKERRIESSIGTLDQLMDDIQLRNVDTLNRLDAKKKNAPRKLKTVALIVKEIKAEVAEEEKPPADAEAEQASAGPAGRGGRGGGPMNLLAAIRGGRGRGEGRGGGLMAAIRGGRSGGRGRGEDGGRGGAGGLMAAIRGRGAARGRGGRGDLMSAIAARRKD